MAVPLLLAAPLPGCHLIFPYQDRPAPGSAAKDGPGDNNPDLGDKDGDGGKGKDKGKHKEAGIKLDNGSCPPPITAYPLGSSPGNWRFALAQGVLFSSVIITPAQPGMYLHAIDHTNEASGFIFTMPTTSTDMTSLLNQAVNRLAAWAGTVGGSARLITSGMMKKSHDNHDSLVGLRMELTLKSDKKPPEVRKLVASALLKQDASKLSGWPAWGYTRPAKKTFVVAMAIVKRAKEKSVVVTGSVAAMERATERAAKAGIFLDDMSNGTAVAEYSAQLYTGCRIFTPLKGDKPKADIIWVMDESGSMEQENKVVAGSSANLFSLASSYRLDYRLGVTGMIAATKGIPPGSYLGKFCSTESTNTNHDGGTDRFLLPSEKSIISVCLKNPPYYEGGAEYGLANAFKAVTRHLPQTSTIEKGKIRSGAELAIIVITDEAPQEIKQGTTWKGTGFISKAADLQGCALSGSLGTKLAPFIKPWTTLLGGKDSTWGVGATGRLFLLSGHCKAPCSPNSETPWGYQEISRATGGQQASLCQLDLRSTLEVYMEDIIGAASPLKLTRQAVSPSLKFRLDGNLLTRSREKGFDYRVVADAIVLVGHDYTKGASATAAYSYWK